MKRLKPQDLGLEKKPPIADKRPQSQTFHGRELLDDYAWLKDPGYPKVEDKDILAYLEAENDYYQAALAPYDALQDTLFEEMKGRIKEDDASVPFKKDQWLYHWRFEKGAQYRQWYRQALGADGNPKGEPERILDIPSLAAEHEFFKLGGFAISPNGQYLAYSADTDGSERFTLRVIDLGTGQPLSDHVEETLGSPTWAADNETLLYLKVNAQWRPYQVWAHRLGDPIDGDILIYEEQDPSFFVGVSKTTSGDWLCVTSGDHVTQEARLIPANAPTQKPRLVAERQAGHEYYVDHLPAAFAPEGKDTLFIRTNDVHKNFRVVRALSENPEPAAWQEEIAPSDSVYIRDIQCFAKWLVVEERVEGLDQIRVRTYDGKEHHVAFPEPVYVAGLGTNAELACDTIRLHYESMVTPSTVYDYSPDQEELHTLKVQEIPSGYDPSLYESHRLFASARDGEKIPVSIVHRKDFPKDGSAPLHLYAYGAYGIGIPPGFSSTRLSLLDRGFAYAIAHIRGGDEMGYHWYEDGKLFSRQNTFNDFVDVGEFLVAEGFARRGGISISGGSAGGELMGAVANMAPDLWAAVVAHVPFVDVLSTMLDKDLPLTPIEWPEWGNPIEDPKAYDYIASYSPYDKVSAQDYPPIMVTAGLNDPRVTYWEPAKWVARLRATKTDDHLLVLKTNMGAGHGGLSGRFRRLKEVAEEYVFVLLAFGRA